MHGVWIVKAILILGALSVFVFIAVAAFLYLKSTSRLPRTYQEFRDDNTKVSVDGFSKFGRVYRKVLIVFVTVLLASMILVSVYNTYLR